MQNFTKMPIIDYIFILISILYHFLNFFFRNDNVAECVFESLEEKTPKAYNALVCGRAKVKFCATIHLKLQELVTLWIQIFSSLLK